MVVSTYFEASNVELLDGACIWIGKTAATIRTSAHPESFKEKVGNGLQ